MGWATILTVFMLIGMGQIQKQQQTKTLQLLHYSITTKTEGGKSTTKVLLIQVYKLYGN